MGQISIIDVAKKAGVSKSTVSRVLTGGSVSEKAKKAVYLAVESLHYAPNQMAQGLRGAKTHVIGAVLGQNNILMNPSVATRIAGINSVLFDAGYSLLLINVDMNHGAVSEAIRFLENHTVEGLIFLSYEEKEKEYKKILDYRPIVYTGECLEPNKGFRVYLGNYHYSRDVYCYLLGNGHRTILSVFDTAYGEKLVKRRKEACADACKMFNTSFDTMAFIDRGESVIDSEKWLDTLYEKFVSCSATAIFVDSIEFANQIVNYFSRRGLNLLDDYSVIAIERVGLQGKKDTTITAVCLPGFDYGEKCAKLLLEVLKDEKLKTQEISIPYTLEIRHSVKNITELNAR